MEIKARRRKSVATSHPATEDATLRNKVRNNPLMSRSLLGWQLSEACENFDRPRTPELYAASPFEGNGASLSVSERAGFPNGQECAWYLIALPGNELSVQGLLDAHREIAGHLHLANISPAPTLGV
jgi:hypothetical protein